MDTLELLQTALNQAISVFKQLNQLECEDLLQHCLILIPTLFYNYMILQPKSPKFNVVKVHRQLTKALNQSMEVIRQDRSMDTDCEKALDRSTDVINEQYQTVCTAIKHARTSSELIKVIEYLLHPKTNSGRYEALASVVFIWQKRRINVDVLSDKEVRNLPSVVILGSTSSPKGQKIQDLKSSALVSKATREYNLLFEYHKYQGSFPHHKIKSLPFLPWMHLDHSEDSGHVQPVDTNLLRIIHLGFQRAVPELQGNPPKENESVCHICQLLCSETHTTTEYHIKQLTLFNKFSVLHEDYITFANKLQKEDQKIQNLLNYHKRLIEAINATSEWMRGITLMQTYCIPKVKAICMITQHQHIAPS